MLPYQKSMDNNRARAILSHAAIVCRAIAVPFVAHVKNATKKLKTDKIFIDADKGIVKIIQYLFTYH